MKEPKKVLLVAIVILLIGAVGYLTYLLQDGSNPLVMFNTRASSDNPDVDNPLLASAGTTDPYRSTSPSVVPSTSVTPSTSITPSTSVTPNASVSPSKTVSPTVTSLPTATLIPSGTPLPTQVKELPVAGVNDQMPLYLLGGGALVVLALLF